MMMSCFRVGHEAESTVWALTFKGELRQGDDYVTRIPIGIVGGIHSIGS